MNFPASVYPIPHRNNRLLSSTRSLVTVLAKLHRGGNAPWNLQFLTQRNYSKASLASCKQRRRNETTYGSPLAEVKTEAPAVTSRYERDEKVG